jgi:drug/metabolite transporter (DMT)-like permease
VATAFVCMVALVIEGLPSTGWFKETPFLIATLYMGWFSTAIAFILYYRLIHEMGAFKASAIAYLIPLTAVLLDFLFNRNIPTVLDLVGAGIILAAIFIIQDRKLRTTS